MAGSAPIIPYLEAAAPYVFAEAGAIVASIPSLAGISFLAGSGVASAVAAGTAELAFDTGGNLTTQVVNHTQTYVGNKIKNWVQQYRRDYDRGENTQMSTPQRLPPNTRNPDISPAKQVRYGGPYERTKALGHPTGKQKFNPNIIDYRRPAFIGPRRQGPYQPVYQDLRKPRYSMGSLYGRKQSLTVNRPNRRNRRYRRY